MSATIERMAKANQVRIHTDAVSDLAIIAAAFDMSVPKYVEQICREAIKRDYPKAVKIVEERARPRSK